MSLVEDVRTSFKAKGLTFVSLTESSEDPEKTTLTYTDGSGKTIHKEVKTRLEMLEDMIEDLDRMEMEPTGLADFLLEDSK
jgi:hypothetical protein